MTSPELGAWVPEMRLESTWNQCPVVAPCLYTSDDKNSVNQKRPSISGLPATEEKPRGFLNVRFGAWSPTQLSCMTIRVDPRILKDKRVFIASENAIHPYRASVRLHSAVNYGLASN